MNHTGGTRTRLAIGAVLLAACILISLTYNPKVGSEYVPGLVLEIEAEGLHPSEDLVEPHARVLVAVGDSSETHILLPPPVPRPGHFIPMKADYYHKGNVEYSLDLETYTLEGLYIRLLLEKELAPEQILVVTFTRAATEELKSRIRKKLVMLMDTLVSRSDDAFQRRPGAAASGFWEHAPGAPETDELAARSNGPATV